MERAKTENGTNTDLQPYLSQPAVRALSVGSATGVFALSIVVLLVNYSSMK